MAEGLEISSISAVEHLVRFVPARIRNIHFHLPHERLNARLGELYQRAKQAGIRLDCGHRPNPPEPVKATMHPFMYTDFSPFIDSLSQSKLATLLALDHLQDPQNFGALCRTADGLGIAGILLPKDRSVIVGPGVYHASAGAVETIPIVHVTNLGESLRKLKERKFWIVGATTQGATTPPWEIPSFDKVVLVLGAELEGLSPSIDKLCDWRTQIPLAGQVLSLNVSNAGAILMYELCRRSRLTN